MMTIEDEMQHEVKRLEREVHLLDEELERLHKKILQVIMVRKKKDHDLRILKAENNYKDEGEFQTTLARLLKSKV